LGRYGERGGGRWRSEQGTWSGVRIVELGGRLVEWGWRGGGGESGWARMRCRAVGEGGRKGEKWAGGLKMVWGDRIGMRGMGERGGEGVVSRRLRRA